MEYKMVNDQYKKGPIFGTLIESEIKGNFLTARVACPVTSAVWKGFLLTYNYRIEHEREEYYVEADSIVLAGRSYEMTLKLDLAKFPFKMTHWAINVVYEKDGESYYAGIQKPRSMQPVYLKQFLFHKNFCLLDNDMIVFQYRSRGGYWGLRYRIRNPYDGMGTRWKEWIATVVFRLNEKRYEKKPGVYLIYEKRCEKAQDNGYHFFRFCMENNMEKYLNRQIFYVISKKSVDWKKVSKYKDHVLDFMSLKYMIYMLRCQLLISSDARNHSYIWQNQDSLLVEDIRQKRHVFLGHGVLALKKLNENFTARNMRSVLCTVTSEAEGRIFKEELGFGPHQVAVTGYPRFDALQDMSDGFREILVMPTHRRWVFGIEREIFVQSEYYRRYMELINSPHLMEQLEKHDLTLNFYLHPSIGEHIDAFSGGSDRVKIIPYGQYALDDLMMRCKLLITDYSSISWDLYFMGKPIILYQFDMEDYQNTWGSYIDLKKDSPGERVEEIDQLLQAIDEYIENGFAMKEEVLAKREEQFAFLDRNNSKRVCDVLKERNL